MGECLMFILHFKERQEGRSLKGLMEACVDSAEVHLKMGVFGLSVAW